MKQVLEVVNNLAVQVNTSIQTLSGKVDGVSNRIDILTVRMDKVEVGVNSLSKDVEDVKEAVTMLADQTEQRFNKVDERFDKVENRMESMDVRLNRVESQMVTKAYLDDKLADLKGDLVELTRKEDKKLTAVVDTLFENELISGKQKKNILAMEPFKA